MNKKIAVLALLAAFLMVSVAPYAAEAGDHKGKDGHDKSLDKKISYKAELILKNKDELGLSDKQVDKIKSIKYATKRELIKQNAEIELAKLEVKEKLYTDKIDVAGINPLIDKKHDLKKAKAKYLVKQYADLKATLTDEQMKELKAIWKKSCKKMKAKQ